MSRLVPSNVSSPPRRTLVGPIGPAFRGFGRLRPFGGCHEFRPTTVEPSLGDLAEQVGEHLPGIGRLAPLVAEAHGVVESNLVHLGAAAGKVAGYEAPVL